MPEVIVIDEIGPELEAQAARTIAERGVQLIGTAHGNTLENLMLNPTLSDLIGGIQTVTLGDEEAKRRGTQKSILERTSPPTFDIVVEIQDWDKVAIHADVSQAVDAILRGQPLDSEVRWLDEAGEVKIERKPPETTSRTRQAKPPAPKGEPPSIYLFGINRGRFEQMAQEMQLTLNIVKNLAEARLFVTSKNYYRRKPQKIREAEEARLPIYVLRSNTPHQIRQLLGEIFPAAEGRARASSIKAALVEAEEAVGQIKEGEESVELSPQSAYIRRLQHLIAERNQILSQSTGKDPNRRVRIYR
jgi:hypothetical protein